MHIHSELKLCFRYTSRKAHSPAAAVLPAAENTTPIMVNLDHERMITCIHIYICICIQTTDVCTYTYNSNVYISMEETTNLTKLCSSPFELMHLK